MAVQAVSRGRRAKPCLSQQIYAAQTNDELCAPHNPSAKRRRLMAVQPPPLTSKDLLLFFGARQLPSSASSVRRSDCTSKIAQDIEHSGAMSFHDPPSPVLGSVYVEVEDDAYRSRQRHDSSGDESLYEDVIRGRRHLHR